MIAINASVLLISMDTSKGSGSSMTVPIKPTPTGKSINTSLASLTRFAVRRRFLAGGSGCPLVNRGKAEVAALVVTV